MVSGFLFYWFSWIFWIVVTFLMKKNNRRTLLACWILISIVSSKIYVPVLSYSVSLSFIVVVLGATLLLIRLPNLVYLLFSSFTTMIGYAAIRFWEQGSPAWVFLPRIILISFILSLLIIILVKRIHSQIGVCLLGVSCGELIYGLTLKGYGINITVGELAFFDNLLFIVVILIFTGILHKGKHKILSFLRNYKQASEVVK